MNSDAKALKETQFVDKQMDEAMLLSEEKIQLSLKCYEDVDKYIRKLDEELANYNFLLAKGTDIVIYLQFF